MDIQTSGGVRAVKILLDTADINYVQMLHDLYPIDGVTTNPTILAKTNRHGIDVLQEIVAVIGTEKMLHVQLLSTSTNAMLEEAQTLSRMLAGNIYIKIPVILEGFRTIKALHEQGIKVTATAVFTAQQALMAAKAGADFVAPYVNRVDNISGDGVKLVADIVHIFHTYQLKTQVLAASFKNVEQVHKVCLAGADAATIGEDVFTNLTCHPLTDWSINKFIEDWEMVHGVGTGMHDFR
jgi:fructose-6-phosphate aldolase 2